MAFQSGQLVYYLAGSPPTFVQVGYVICPIESEHADDLWRLACNEPDSTLWHQARAENIFVNIWDALFELENRINWQINQYRECIKGERKRVLDMVTRKAE